MPKIKDKIKIEAYVIYDAKNRQIEARRRWIDVDNLDKRADIRIYSTEAKAKKTIEELLKYQVYKNKEIYPIKINIDLDLGPFNDTFLESLHPETNLGWMGNGHRHPVDADTFTIKSAGDTIKVHVSDDLPDIEYEVRDGSYLDDEAIKYSPYFSDVAARFEPTNDSKNNFNDSLNALIRDALRAEIADIIKKDYQHEPLTVHSGGSSGNVPTDVSLEVSNKRRIPAMYNDKDTFLEELSHEMKEKLANCNNIFEVEELLGRKPNEEEYKVFIYPKMLEFYDEYKEWGVPDKEIRTEMKDSFYYEDLIQKVFDEKTKDVFLESADLKEEKSDDIYDFIEDLYELRKNSINKEGEYGLGNLVFKEFRNLGYLDNLKELRKKEKSKELSLEDLNMKDELKEVYGQKFSKKILNLAWSDFNRTYWQNALHNNKDKYVAASNGGEYYVYERHNNDLNHILTYIPGYNVMYYEDDKEIQRLADINDYYLEECHEWDITEGKKKRIADYRKLANIDDNFVITEENLDEQALNNTCRINYDYPKDELIKELLN